MRIIYRLWDRYYRSVLIVMSLASLAIWASVACQAIGRPVPMATPYPTPTPYPTFMPQLTEVPFDQKFLSAVLDRVMVDKTIPEAGRRPMISLIGGEPTFAFPDNTGLVLQFIISEVPGDAPTVDQITSQLIGTGVAMADEQGIPLDAVEVVYFVAEDRPWIAMVLTPPWDARRMMVAPLDPEYIKRLKEVGVITPTPEPTY